MDEADAEALFRETVGELLGIAAGELVLAAIWDDLEVDSLALTEIAIALCDAFEIRLPDVEPDQIATVQQTFDLVLVTVADPAFACPSPTRRTS